jgi:ribosome-binding protein aMBF1 (putative translation factor)
LVNDARRKGEAQSYAKPGGGQNPVGKPSARPSKVRALDSNEAPPPTYVSREFSQGLIRARNEKNLTQAELAAKLNRPKIVIEKYENGTAIPEPNVTRDLRRMFPDLPAVQ